MTPEEVRRMGDFLANAVPYPRRGKTLEFPPGLLPGRVLPLDARRLSKAEFLFHMARIGVPSARLVRDIRWIDLQIDRVAVPARNTYFLGDDVYRQWWWQFWADEGPPRVDRLAYVWAPLSKNRHCRRQRDPGLWREMRLLAGFDEEDAPRNIYSRGNTKAVAVWYYQYLLKDCRAVFPPIRREPILGLDITREPLPEVRQAVDESFGRKRLPQGRRPGGVGFGGPAPHGTRNPTGTLGGPVAPRTPRL